MSTFAAAMDNSGKEAEAMALLAEAERKVKNSQSFFSGLFGGSSKIEEACEIYARAANMFKMAKNWSAAGNAFCQAAQLHLQLQSKHDAATCFVDAGNAFKKADPQEAINCLMRAIEIYTDMVRVTACPVCPVASPTILPQLRLSSSGPESRRETGKGRFTIAAKHHISIAEIYETELVDIEKAIAHYEQSADYYKGEESNSSANKCLLKVAGYAAQLEEYQKAVDIYEQVGAGGAPSPPLGGGTAPPPLACRAPLGNKPRSQLAPKCLAVTLVLWLPACSCLQVGTNAMDSPLLKYSAKDYFFKAALCHFCIDMLNAKLAVQKYEELFPAFSDSRECKLMKKLLEAHEEQNVDSYTEAVKEYDAISRLDQWLTTMLLRVKKTIQGDEEDLR
ncbi:hypothetical protein J1605_016317 [Eschrichtius robustus]|uniref:Alpha-soluble NSF attachment protein n=1 Tax=Eschrichtius robustus TaxID=9764 RepID=A0AB34G7X7_ESCRO|nr:hypothetical protein J1605_016317 [Eschrichtius robustus]